MKILTYFNWKKFITKDCKTITAWLEEQGQAEPAQVILKAVALILRGETKAVPILTAACSSEPLETILTVDPQALEPVAVAGNIEKLLGYWVHSLPRDAVLLGRIYEKMVLSRRLQGNYYTPDAAITFIVANTVAQCDIVADPAVKVLDPACGCGYFLLQAYDILYQKFMQCRDSLAKMYPQLDLSESGIHAHIMTHNLWGADIDQTAAAITAIALSLKHPASRRSGNIVVYDSLMRPGGSGLTAKNRQLWSNQYDYVIGNPPYLSFGLRGTGKLEPQYREYLRQAYADSAEYKLSYYVLFIQRGIELLKANGQLGYIIPDSFLLGRYYSKIRRYIMDNTAIKLVAHLNCNVFSNASTGYSVICVLQKNNKATETPANMMKIYQVEAIEQLPAARPVCQYEQSYFHTQPFLRFRIYFDLNIRAIVEKIDAGSAALKTYASGHTGIRSLTRQCDIVALASGGDDWRQGLVSGSQVHRYRLDYNGHWLNINPGLLYTGGWRQNIVEQRKILIRQTGDTIIAGIDDNGFYHLNNIHSFVLTASVVTLDYLLLILNSRLMAFYYHVTSMEYGRPMAQTDIETLELLPIAFNSEIDSQAPELVATMTECVKKAAVNAAGMRSFDEYLNQLVYRIYRLSDAEIETIERYEAGLVKRSHRKGRYARST
ncbi:TaqI-like C-terminal specificity domain-containing protein [Dendrosporobacter quercicolus]|uniref:site-specific DNA-methyltransferase (adenine-specific) n=1 Tax=Dendrosporobacter quercicolus TaxID=146817 RepID=A0A1G9LGC6_9FIRM|nr:TaqI-like C-terminal specificity domain-containing protein [Dendrosporobacter quercicolus]